MLADHAIKSDRTTLPLADLRGKRLIALAAIAHPEPFFSMLRAKGLVLQQAIALPDHDDFQGWTPWADPAVQLIFTEKDAIKLWRREPNGMAVPLIIKLSTAFLRDFDVLLDARLSSLQLARTDAWNG